VQRSQEYKKYSIIWSFNSPQLSEGIEDEANMEGISYIDFFDYKDADSAVAFDAKESDKFLNTSIGKRDLTPYLNARDNVKCVYKNSDDHKMED